MKRLSLRARTIIAGAVMLLIFLPATVFTLEKAYTESLLAAKQNELKLINLALVSEFEFDGNIPSMPELLYEEQLNLPGSGYIGIVMINNAIVWRSASALSLGNLTVDDISPAHKPRVGEEYFSTEDVQLTGQLLGQLSAPPTAYFSYLFTAEFAADDGFKPVTFYVLNDATQFTQDRDMFLTTTWRWLLFIAIALLVVLVFSIALFTAPIRKIIGEVELTAKGEQHQLDGHYPIEFHGLTSSINALLETEQQQRQRYKNSLGDLAHSLKTPLAVAQGCEPLPDTARHALVQINQLIERQLKRASAGTSAWQERVEVAPIVEKIVNAMGKVYRDKNLRLDTHYTAPGLFAGDATDLMEIVGNLLDNACKAARSKVSVTITAQAKWTTITIIDDGPGIPKDQRQQLLERGNRLDTYSEGQGIGMAVVTDLLGIYEGRLMIADSELGGASVQVQLPN